MTTKTYVQFSDEITARISPISGYNHGKFLGVLKKRLDYLVSSKYLSQRGTTLEALALAWALNELAPQAHAPPKDPVVEAQKEALWEQFENSQKIKL